MAQDKQRHGFLTIWLVLMLIGNSTVIYTNATGAQAMREALPALPGWVVPVSLLLGVVSLVCTLALFMWKKWGFWVLCLLSVIGFGINLVVGLGLGMAMLGFAGVVILFVALMVGGDRQGWAQLE